MVHVETCGECGKEDVNRCFRRGWTMALYCSELCERSAVSRLHASMPGAGPAPSVTFVPHHIDREITCRWDTDE